MPIRLLQKKEIDVIKAKERKIEIDEGVKLAKRIDSLREIQAEEEASLYKFRCETVSKIGKEITEKSFERDTLIHEISQLKDKRVALEKPLTAEWKSLEKEKESFAGEKKEFDKQKDLLSQKDKEVSQRIKETVDEFQRAEEKEERANKFLVEADDIKKTAEEIFISNKKERQEIKKAKRDIEKDFEIRNGRCTERGTKLITWEKDLTEKETDLANREYVLTDKYKTFERAQKYAKR